MEVYRAIWSASVNGILRHRGIWGYIMEGRVDLVGRLMTPI